jgi:4-alpha-glucanotransferase
MNLPATPSGNWRWRFRSGTLTPSLARRLKELTEVYER